MSKTVLTKFRALPDQGNLKRQAGEYAFTQNVRGWGNRGAKRTGIQTRVTLDAGVMGIFDLKIDGEALSPDKIMVYDYNGDIILYDYSELISIFDFLFSSGSALYLQSPNLNWWSISVTANSSIMETQVAAPVTTISEDLQIAQNEIFGFNNTTVFNSIYISSGNIKTKIYGLSTPVTNYTTTQAFVNGVGPVFEDSNLNRFRLIVANGGILESIQV